MGKKKRQTAHYRAKMCTDEYYTRTAKDLEVANPEIIVDLKTRKERNKAISNLQHLKSGNPYDLKRASNARYISKYHKKQVRLESDVAWLRRRGFTFTWDEEEQAA